MTGSPPPNDVHSISQPNDWFGVMNVAVAHHLVGTDSLVGLLRSKCTSMSEKFQLSHVFSESCREKREKLQRQYSP